MNRSRIDVLGCPVDVVDLPGALRRVAALVEGGGGTVAAVNASKLVRMRDDPLLRHHVRRADLVVADGASVLAAARAQGTPLPGRVTGVDLCDGLLREAPRLRIFLLGARPEVVETLGRQRGAVAWHHGWFDDPRPVLDRIHEARPDLLLVAMGTPRQEHFIETHRAQLPPCTAMGVGGSFDVLTGRVRRAPRALGEFGLEWAWRLALEPRARWRRALGDSARFTWRALRGQHLPDDA